MTNFLPTLKSVLGLNFSEQASREIDERREILGSEVAGRFGRGNTAIQDLGMLTRNDLDREILEVRGLTFGGR